MLPALIWIVVGFALVIAEFFLTSFVVVFLGLAAILVGLAVWLGFPVHSGLPYLLWAALALGLLFGLRSHLQRWFKGGIAADSLDEDFLGREVRIESGFDSAQPGRGRVSYRGANWDARSDQAEFAPGSYARIVAREGMLLRIEPT